MTLALGHSKKVGMTAPLILSTIAMASDLLGGVLFLHPAIARMDNRYIVGLASGVVISATFFELLPEARVSENALFLATGFFLFYILEKVVMLHSCGEKECESHTLGWVAAVGMASDNIIDGIGIAVGYATDPVIGVVITLAVIIHELPQGITTAVLMKNSGFRLRDIFLTLLLAGIMYPAGAYLSRYIPEELHATTIAFVAGSFLYIGVGDLLTEAHKTFNIRVVFSVIGGALLPLLLNLLTG